MDEQRTLTLTWPTTEGEAPTTLALPPRYRLGSWLGAGGMGTVWSVYDEQLQREVALKVLHRGTPDDLLREARVAARLDHPAILPVHDVFELPGGRLAFTMRLVRGRPMSAEIPGMPRRRRLDLLRRITEALAFAHDVGVVHRDLKPSNVLLGPFGEVWVVDWGLAGSGARGGTPGYMAPEQIPTPAADVYALGAMLGMLLTDRPPDGRPPDGDDDLAVLAGSALQADPGRRPSTQEFARRLAAWLDGERARERALDHVARADALAVEVQQAQDALRADAARHAVLSRDMARTAPLEDKRVLWDLEDALEERKRTLARLEAAWERALHAALSEVPALPEARKRLAERAIARVEEAEELGDAGAAERLAEDVQVWDRQWYRSFRSAKACLVLTTDPPATATLHPWVSVDRRLVEGPGVDLGSTPLDLSLDPGSWLVVLRAPGRATVRYPIQLRRARTWTGAITLPRDLPGVCWVPAGPAWFGGDPLAPNSGPRVRAELAGFGMMRFPVTNREYAAFLNGLVASGQRELSERLVPRLEVSGSPPYRWTGGEWVPGVDGQGHHWHPDLPVVCVGWEAARQYAAWCAEQTGLAWRLPGDLEWEKAARGVDGRAFPWGDHFDYTWTNTRWTRPDDPLPVVVDSYPSDVSPYGIRGLAGNVIDWVLDDLSLANWPEHGGVVAPPVEATGDWRAYRGGAWTLNEPDCRSAGRIRNWADHRSSAIGFRLALAWVV